jgi:hypothetical protein
LRNSEGPIWTSGIRVTGDSAHESPAPPHARLFANQNSAARKPF